MISQHSQLLEAAASEISRMYSALLEERIHLEVRSFFGHIPFPSVIRRLCRVVKCRVGDDCYDEFQIDGEPKFQQRVIIKDQKVSIEIKVCAKS